MSVVGDNIRALRTLYGKDREITQAELADIAGVTRETVNKWESGAIGNVRTANIDRMRAHFGLSVDDLRSESAGLAARLCEMRGGGRPCAPQDGDKSVVPCVALVDVPQTLPSDLWDLEGARPAEVPAAVLESHPRAFAFVVADASMAHVLPQGCCAVADADAKACEGSVVVAWIVGADKPVVRRLRERASGVVLSSEGVDGTTDASFDAADVLIVASVVWYQAAAELG